MNKNVRRPKRRLFYCLIALIVCASLAHAQAPALTTINDTVYRADGTPAAGQLVITWPAFTTADNKPVAAGEKTLTLSASGALNTQLAPNEGATPTGSYYKVVYKLSDGTTATEYWTVPATTPTNIGAIRATVVPAQVAAQLVTRQYVDSVLGGSTTDLVHKSTAETITGSKTFTGLLHADGGLQVGSSGATIDSTGSGTFTTITVTDGGSLSGAFTGAPAFTGSAAFKSFNGVLNATQFPGATLEAQVEAAYAALPSTGGEIYIPAGTYNSNAGCFSLNTAAKPVILRGAGQDATTINFTHTGDGICNILPINSSTSSLVVIRDMTLNNSNAANTGAAIDQVGGTYFQVHNVKITGKWKYGVVLDQSELADVDLLNCNLLDNTLVQRCVWLVNGSEHSPGALTGFTNRISVRRSNLNMGVNSYGVVDDGGAAHTFADNNYNGGLYGIWISAVTEGIIEGSEFEGMVANAIKITNWSPEGQTKGQPFSLGIRHNMITPPNTVTPIDIASAGTLQIIGNEFGRNGNVITGGNNANTIFSSGNVNSFTTTFYPTKATRHTSLSDYPNGGSISDYIGNSVEFGKDIVVAGSSASPATNKFQITGASTGGTRTVTLADGNSVTVIPDPGAANNFVTGITAAGAITKAQPTFANLSGTLGVSQGGTGQTTFTKGDLLAAANSTTLNKLPVGTDGQVLTADSTQTNGMKWASTSTLLDYQKAGSAIVGDGTDKTVFTYTLPGGTLAAGKGLRILTELQHTTGTGNITYKIFFGSTQVLAQASTSTVIAKIGAIVFNDPGSTTSQQGTATDLLFGSTVASLPTAPAVGAENTANPVVIKVTFNAAATEQVTPKVWLVEAIK